MNILQSGIEHKSINLAFNYNFNNGREKISVDL